MLQVASASSIRWLPVMRRISAIARAACASSQWRSEAMRSRMRRWSCGHTIWKLLNMPTGITPGSTCTMRRVSCELSSMRGASVLPSKTSEVLSSVRAASWLEMPRLLSCRYIALLGVFLRGMGSGSFVMDCVRRGTRAFINNSPSWRAEKPVQVFSWGEGDIEANGLRLGGIGRMVAWILGRKPSNGHHVRSC